MSDAADKQPVKKTPPQNSKTPERVYKSTDTIWQRRAGEPEMLVRGHPGRLKVRCRDPFDAAVRYMDQFGWLNDDGTLSEEHSAMRDLTLTFQITKPDAATQSLEPLSVKTILANKTGVESVLKQMADERKAATAPDTTEGG